MITEHTKIEIKLTEHQLEMKKYLDFLFDTRSNNTRQSGRTTVMALSILECALQNVGSPIYFFDHYLLQPQGRGCNRAMSDMLISLLNMDPRIKFEISVQRSYLKITNITNLAEE